MTEAELKARIAELEAINAKQREKLQTRSNTTLTFKVGEKGGVSVYGLGRFPVSLYYKQWKRLGAVWTQLDEFLEEQNALGKLKHKEGDE